eukprot:594324-Rhodomonas_salina.2
MRWRGRCCLPLDFIRTPKIDHTLSRSKQAAHRPEQRGRRIASFAAAQHTVVLWKNEGRAADLGELHIASSRSQLDHLSSDIPKLLLVSLATAPRRLPQRALREKEAASAPGRAQMLSASCFSTKHRSAAHYADSLGPEKAFGQVCTRGLGARARQELEEICMLRGSG